MLTKPILRGVPRALRLFVPCVLALCALGIKNRTERLDADANSPYPVVRNLTFSELAAREARAIPEMYGELSNELPFRRGETLSAVLGDLGLSGVEANRVTESLAEYADMRRLKPNDRYASRVNAAGELEEFVLRLGGRGRVRAVPAVDGSWKSRWAPFERRMTVHAISGELDGALELAIEESGGESNLAFLMADVLQWDIDFTRDLRLGDRFEILYEKVYLDGSFHGLGDILALEYTNGDREIEAYRFGDEESSGYYDNEGRPMRKMFLRSPMTYSRVTSRFSKRRFHPVLKRYRPHYGVDYGAPTGTPVKVTANGVVLSAGWDRGGGNTVKVRHPNGYITAYLHLSRFGKGVRSGKRVAQGDVIGFVGSTGLSTGPHLDYRVKHHGRWIDPLSLRAVPADPIPTDRLAEFGEQRDRYRQQLSGAPLSNERTLRVATTSDAPSGAAGGR